MKNKVALIIGAGDAIGSAIARKFAMRGLTICATRRNEDKLKPLIEEISSAGGKAFGFGCDARCMPRHLRAFNDARHAEL